VNASVETLGPTRVKLTVEVPFDELGPSVDSAYRKIGQQVRLKGFRPGKVPPRILDQYVGRAAVLEEAVNDALPKLYGAAVRDNDVQIIGQPEIEVTQFTDGDQLVFTAEVDVRPEVPLPEYQGLPVTVDDATVADADVDAQVGNLRDLRLGCAHVSSLIALGTGCASQISARAAACQATAGGTRCASALPRRSIGRKRCPRVRRPCTSPRSA